MTANFWMIVSNAENFRRTQELGFTVQGLKLQQKRKLQRIGTGDRVLFYVSGIRRFTATATVTSSYFPEETPIWDPEGVSSWPYRIQIKPEIALEDAQYIDANMLAPRLEYVKRWPPENWYMAFQGNLHLLPKSDFLLIEEEMKKLRFGKDYKPTLLAPPPDGSRRKKSSSRRRKLRATEAGGAVAGDGAANGGDRRPNPNPRAGNRPTPSPQTGSGPTPGPQTGNRPTPSPQGGNRPTPSPQAGNRPTPDPQPGVPARASSDPSQPQAPD